MLTATTAAVEFSALVPLRPVPDTPPTALAGMVTRTADGPFCDWTLSPSAPAGLRRVYEGWRRSWLDSKPLGDLVTVGRIIDEVRAVVPHALSMVSVGTTVAADDLAMLLDDVDTIAAAAQEIDRPSVVVTVGPTVIWYALPCLDGDIVAGQLDWTLVADQDGLHVTTDQATVPLTSWDNGPGGLVPSPAVNADVPHGALKSAFNLSMGWPAAVTSGGSDLALNAFASHLRAAATFAKNRNLPLTFDATERT